MESILPKYVKVCLWSYDTDKINFNLPEHRTKAIYNILNFGTSKAIEWLRLNFSEKEIAEVIKKSSISSWNKKSLSLWSLVFDSHPTKQVRFM